MKNRNILTFIYIWILSKVINDVSKLKELLYEVLRAGYTTDIILVIIGILLLFVFGGYLLEDIIEGIKEIWRRYNG